MLVSPIHVIILCMSNSDNDCMIENYP